MMWKTLKLSHTEINSALISSSLNIEMMMYMGYNSSKAIEKWSQCGGKVPFIQREPNVAAKPLWDESLPILIFLESSLFPSILIGFKLLLWRNLYHNSRSSFAPRCKFETHPCQHSRLHLDPSCNHISFSIFEWEDFVRSRKKHHHLGLPLVLVGFVVELFCTC